MLDRHHQRLRESFNQLTYIFCKEAHQEVDQLVGLLYARYLVENELYASDTIRSSVFYYFGRVVIPHKVEVFRAGRQFAQEDWFLDFIGEPLELWLDNLFLHDLSKFSAEESFGYAFHNFKSNVLDRAFDRAWMHHKNHNPHHPEYWLNPNKSGVLEPLEMPKIYIAEMVADWIGAGKVYGNTLEEWLPNNLHKFYFHPNTINGLQYMLASLGHNTQIQNKVLTIV